MLIGYARVSKSDGSQNLDLQRDELIKAGVDKKRIYEEYASGKREDRPVLDNCLKALRPKEDTLVVWKLDRLGRNLRHLIEIVQDLETQGIGFQVLTGKGSCIDTTTASGKMIFAIFAALSEYERELISERTKAGLKAARARGRKGGRKFIMTRTKLNIARTALKDPDTNINELCKELRITRYTLYRYLSPEGELREYAHKLISMENA
ncbi:recombinase family protein [Candidatus Jidaibacter acanthamoebae]|uniref:recombinase family protein n=1 Tax=Candidatus Jidaibacter acanthamoebae TaxID=86105 RepID=UPI00057DF7D8|nr:recombinase family protein [Candidatus Jidaibacter acanthamoeba]